MPQTGCSATKTDEWNAFVETIFVILGTVVALIVALTSFVSWVYKLGQVSGAERAGQEASRLEEKAKLAALQRGLDEATTALADTRTQLAALQSQRPSTE